jgi:hypothetical protein
MVAPALRCNLRDMLGHLEDDHDNFQEDPRIDNNQQEIQGRPDDQHHDAQRDRMAEATDDEARAPKPAPIIDNR